MTGDLSTEWAMSAKGAWAGPSMSSMVVSVLPAVNELVLTSRASFVEVDRWDHAALDTELTPVVLFASVDVSLEDCEEGECNMSSLWCPFGGLSKTAVV